MNVDEARQFLEDHDFCLKHFLKKQATAGKRGTRCTDCVREQELAEKVRANEAIRVLTGKAPAPPPPSEGWTPIEIPPPATERVYLLCNGFRESGKPGGRDSYVTGRPLFWRRR